MTTLISTSLTPKLESNLLRNSRATPLYDISVALAIVEDNTISAHVGPDTLGRLG
jgi:hypothetical protein